MTVRGKLSGSTGLSPGERAAAWHIRRDAGDLTPAEEREFRAWLDEAPQHRALYNKAGDLWDLLDNVGEDPHIRALRGAALEDKPDRRGHWWLGLAASLVLGVISLFAPLPQFQAEKNGTATGQAEPIEFVQAGGEVQYRTSKGQRLNFTLPDGTTVVMNTDSALTVAYSRGQRLVRLSRGQAFFEVVKNRTRPFVVLAGSKEVMALGTAFEVQVEGGRTHVLLVEGKVAVQPAMHGTDLSAAPAHVLMPGQKLVSDASNETLIRVNVDQAMLWQDGFVEFDDEPLISAVQEMNRYATHPLVIADNRAAFLRLSGIFKTGHTERFVHTISEILPVASRRGSGGIEIVLEVEGD